VSGVVPDQVEGPGTRGREDLHLLSICHGRRQVAHVPPDPDRQRGLREPRADRLGNVAAGGPVGNLELGLHVAGFSVTNLALYVKGAPERILDMCDRQRAQTEARIDRVYWLRAVEILKTKVGVFIDLWRQRRQLQEKAEAFKKLNENLEARAQELSAINRELESFCYTIAHDLRAPLRAMEGLTTLLLEDYAEKLDDAAQDYGERIRSSAARMDQMIQELLSYSRLTLIEFQPQPIRLSRLLKDALSQLAWDLEQKGATINLKRSHHQVLGHYTMLVQVIVNLISNAVKFIPPDVKPVVNIHDEKRGDQVRIWVEDNGIGIAPEHQQRIFRIFERLHGRESYSGTGIGLAIVEKAISRMKGQVGVESDLGKGSRFWVELPYHAVDPDTKMVRKSEVTGPNP